MNYRLLNEGEEIREGDEFLLYDQFTGFSWSKAENDEIEQKIYQETQVVRRRDDTKVEALDWLKALYKIFGEEFNRTGHALKIISLIKRLESEIGEEI